VLDDPHANLRDKVLHTVLQGPGETTPAIRAAAAAGIDLPADVRSLVAKIHAHAYKVTDADLARLGTAYDDDRLFEMVVSAALGASHRRLQIGLDALNEA
jgi:hypothetical protein